jgi:excisionase family DNA binding protein
VEKNILTIPEAAKYCAVDRVTMWRWAKSGLLRTSVTPGGHHRITKEDLESFLIEKGMYPLSTKSFPGNRILIVDDDAVVRESTSEILSRYKYETETAGDGFEAGVKVAQFKPGLVILDLIMPRMDGFEVCRYLKKDPTTSGIKILALTGFDTGEYREKIMAAGADDFLAKPVAADDLIEHMEILLGRKWRS